MEDEAGHPLAHKPPPPPYQARLMTPARSSSMPSSLGDGNRSLTDEPGRTLLLFVHGFFGSEASFGTFPADLAHAMRVPPHKLRNIECRVLPTYDCKGDITKSVNHLCNWLIMNAAAPEFDSVVILAHSMGGLLAVDAFRKLYNADREWEKKHGGPSKKAEPGKDSWFASFWADKKKAEAAAEAAAGTSEKVELVWDNEDGKEHAESAFLINKAPPSPKSRIFPEINIIAIIAYDSPFFGLHPSVYSSAAPTRAASILSPFVPTLPPVPTIALPESLSKAAVTAPSTAYNAVTSAPSAAYDAIRSAPSVAYSTIASAPAAAYSASSAALSAVASAPSAAYSAVTSFPTAAAEGARVAAKGASSAVSHLPAVAAQGASMTLAAGAAAIHATADAVNRNIPAAYTSGVSERLKTAAVNALPGLAIAGTVAVVGAVPGVLGLASAVIPRLTWGRMAIAGAGTMVAAAAVGTRSIIEKEKTKEKFEELELDEKDEEDAGDDVREAAPEPFVPESEAEEGPTLRIKTEEDATEDPDPAVRFDGGHEAIAETAGMETATLIAAAALANSSVLSPTTPGFMRFDPFAQLLSPGPEGSPMTPPSFKNGEGLDLAEELDADAGRILRRASMSVKAGRSRVVGPIVSGEDRVEEVKEELPALTAEGDKPLVEGDKPPGEAEATEATAVPASSSSWVPWLTVGLAGAAVAAGTYYSGGLLLAAPLVQSVAVTWAASHVNEASKHLQFLYPLWGETKEDGIKRLEVLRGEAALGRLTFRCFFVELPPLPVEEKKVKEAEEGKADVKEVAVANEDVKLEKDSTVDISTTANAVPTEDVKKDDEVKVKAAVKEKVDEDVNVNVADAKAANPEVTDSDAKPKDNSATAKPAAADDSAATEAAASLSDPPKQRVVPQCPSPRTFINPPPQSLCHLFQPTANDSEDAIVAHMTLFDRAVNAGGYWDLVDRSAVVVRRAVESWRASDRVPRIVQIGVVAE
ncbi:hypothetical protein HK101_007340 [Irineochytrium annulatum]|nr:hypothetical protein HK101_007340 [Irineochytrium annulatum]